MIRYSIYFLLLASLFSLLGCDTKPNVTAVPMTEPWTSIGFTCDGNGVVIKSSETRFNCAFGGSTPTSPREDALKKIAPYVEAAKKSGWTISQDTPDVAVQYVLTKGGQNLLIVATGAFAIVDAKQITWEGSGIQAEIFPVKP
ncbi:MAG: hypothetical protein QM785_14595 [Pyrinomonadaceae bacterium]